MKNKRKSTPKPSQPQVNSLPPNYLPQVLAWQRAGLFLPGLLQMSFGHDEGCGALVGGTCTCSPEMYINGVRVLAPVSKRG